MNSTRRSQVEYQRRMHAVIEYFDRHLDSNLDLATLAGVATLELSAKAIKGEMKWPTK